MRDLLTPSLLRAYRSCNRKYKLKYLDRLEPVKQDDARGFGSMFHAGLEEWWSPVAFAKGRAADDRLQNSVAAIHAYGLRYAVDDVLRMVAHELFIAYHARWVGSPVVPLAVEQTYRLRLVNPETGRPSTTFDRGGKVDAIVRDLTESRPMIKVLEHKTSTMDISPGSEYWQRLRLDCQVSEYLVGASELGHGEVEGCIYDVIARPLIKLLAATPMESRKFTAGKKCKTCNGTSNVTPIGGNFNELVMCPACDGTGWAEAPRLYANQRDRDETPAEFRERLRKKLADPEELWFGRDTVYRIGEEVAQASIDTWGTGQQIIVAKKLGSFPRNDGSCNQYNRLCEFFALCTGTARADDTTKFTRREHAHAELAEPVNRVEEITDHEHPDERPAPIADLDPDEPAADIPAE